MSDNTDNAPHGVDSSKPLPLAVRESLMRGHNDEAVDALASSYGITNEHAQELISQYKEQLQERNAMLNIQVMREEQQKESEHQKHKAVVWGARLLMGVVTLVLIYVLVSMMGNAK